MWKWWMKNYSEINKTQLARINPELQLCNSRIFRSCPLTLTSFRTKNLTDIYPGATEITF